MTMQRKCRKNLVPFGRLETQMIGTQVTHLVTALKDKLPSRFSFWYRWKSYNALKMERDAEIIELFSFKTIFLYPLLFRTMIFFSVNDTHTRSINERIKKSRKCFCRMCLCHSVIFHSEASNSPSQLLPTVFALAEKKNSLNFNFFYW